MINREVDFVAQAVAGTARNESYAGLNIEDLVLTNCFLGEVQMEECNFLKSTFKKCNFFASEFDVVRFENCDMREADFTGASGEELIFDNCNLDGVQFGSCNIRKLILTECSGKIFAEKAKLEASLVVNCKIAGSDFNGAELVDSHWQFTDMRRIDLGPQADITGATFLSCDIAEVKFSVVEGYQKNMLMDCYATPYVETTVTSSPLNELFNGGVTHQDDDEYSEYDWLYSGMVNHSRSHYNNYPIMDLKAHLYCSDIDMYRKLKR